MTNQTIQHTDLHFPLLTEAAYLSAVSKAENAIRDRVQAPTMEHYSKTSTAAHPRGFTVGIVAALILVMIFSFVVSAGKQAAAMGLILDHLPSKFNHLSELWADTSIAAMLLLGEIGAVLFLVCAGTLAHSASISQIGGRPINVIKLIFRLSAVACASVAIVANLTIAALDPVPQAWVLEAIVSIMPPCMVLTLGLVVERLMIEQLRADASAKIAYNAAVADYEAVVKDPTKHASWAAVLSDCLWAALNLRHKETLAAYTDQDPRYRRWIVQSEYSSHQQSAALELESANPFLLEPGSSLPNLS